MASGMSWGGAWGSGWGVILSSIKQSMIITWNRLRRI